MPYEGCNALGDGLRTLPTGCYVSQLHTRVIVHACGTSPLSSMDLLFAESQSWPAAQAHQVLCSLGQTAATTIAYVFRMSGLRDMLTKYGLSQGDKLVFRCGDHKATGVF